MRSADIYLFYDTLLKEQRNYLIDDKAVEILKFKSEENFNTNEINPENKSFAIISSMTERPFLKESNKASVFANIWQSKVKK